MGVKKTLARLGENFTWANMGNDVRQFFVACLDCQHTKYESKKPGGLVCPLPVPSWLWEDLSMDFIVNLLPYRGNTTILVVVDKFSKEVHLGLLLPSYTALTVASLFMEIVGKYHGMAQSIVSDRDPLFF